MLVRSLASNVLQIAAPAKINLYLELLGKRSDGFHELETVMTTVSLFDQLSFEPNQTGQLRLSISVADAQFGTSANSKTDSGSESYTDPIPTDGRNLVIKSLRKLKELSDTSGDSGAFGMDVQLHKRIPSAAGLGGASSDAAAALIAGNILWKLNLSHARLHDIAAEIGSDVPFFLGCGMAMCRGRGEKIQPIDAPSGLPIVIAKPPAGLSTPRVFGQCELPDRPRQSQLVMEGFQSGSAGRIGDLLLNRLQPAATKLLGDISIIEKEFADLPCLGHQMSGSGSSYFGVFENQRIARRAAAWLSARKPALKIQCVTSLNRTGNLTA